MEPTNPQQPQPKHSADIEEIIKGISPALMKELDAARESSLSALDRRFLELANKIMAPERPLPKIYGLIPKIMEEVGAIGKGRNAPQKVGGYAFRGIDDMYNAIQPALIKYGVFYVPKLLKCERRDRNFSGGAAGVETLVTMEFTFFAEDGSHTQPIITIGEAMDTGDKSANKAMSGALKYALMEFLCIPTEEAKDSENQSYELAGHVPRGTHQPPKTGQGQSRPPQGRTQAPPAQGSHPGKPSGASTAKPQGTGGDYVIDFTNGLAGKKLREIPIEEVEKLLVWQNTKAKVPRPEFVAAANLWIHQFMAEQANSSPPGDVIPFDQFTGEEEQP